MSKYQYWKNRWITLSYEIRFIFVTSLITILVIEFGLSFIPAFNEFLYNLGQFLLKFCYSLTSATIVYFIVQHLPRERKRIKIQSLLSYKILYAESQIDCLLITLFGKDEFDKIDKLSYVECSNLLAENYLNKNVTVNDMYFNDTFQIDEYFKKNIISLLNECNEILTYNEFISVKVLHSISQIKSSCEFIIKVNMLPNAKTLRKYDNFIYTMIQSNLALKADSESYSKKYKNESSAIKKTNMKHKPGERIEGEDIQQVES